MALNDKPSAAGQFVSSVWTFPDRESQDLKSPYRWYGTLPSALVNQLLDLYATPDSHVLDPFCGSGSIGVAAALRSTRSTNVDVNPLAILTARARAVVPDPARLAMIWNEVVAAVEDGGFQRDSRRHLASAVKDDIAYTAKWFAPDVLERTWCLVRAIGLADDAAAATTLYVHVAAAIRSVANVDPRCTHHLVTKLKPYADPVAHVAASIAADKRLPQELSASSFNQGDVTSLPTDVVHDLVIAHPPYLGVIHYNQIHRLSTDLFDLAVRTDDPPALQGMNWSIADLKLNDMSTDNSDRYEQFIERVSDSLVKVTSVGGRAVVIIGDQRHKGLLRHPLTSYVRELETRGFALEENFIWVLQNNGGMHVLRRGHFIDHNYVAVFRRLP